MMAWDEGYQIDPAQDNITVAFLSAVINNIAYIRSECENNGITMPTLKSISVSYATQLNQIQAVFNDIESNITTVDNNCGWINEYYDGAYTWVYYNTGAQAKIQRWIDWLYLNYRIVTGAARKPEYLIDINEEYIYDKNGEHIVVQGDYF